MFRGKNFGVDARQEFKPTLDMLSTAIWQNINKKVEDAQYRGEGGLSASTTVFTL